MNFDSTLVGPIIGLVLIAIGWLLQLASSWSGKRELRKRFIIFYIIGVAVLIIDSFMKGDNISAFFNLVTLILAGIVLAKIGKSDEFRTRKTKKKIGRSDEVKTRNTKKKKRR